MMIRINVLFTVVLLSSLFSLSAQNEGERPERALSGELFNAFPQVYGSFFTQHDWQAGNVYLECGSVARAQMLRYSGYLEELFLMDIDNGDIVKVDKGLVQFFTIEDKINGSQVFRKTDMGSGQNRQTLFLQELFHGEHLVLYKHHRILATGTQTITVHNRNFQQQVLEDKPVYYLAFHEQQQLHRFVTINRQSVFRLINTPRRQLRQILSSNNIQLWKNERGLVSFLKILDERMESNAEQTPVPGK